MSVRDMQNRPRDGRIRGVHAEFMPEKPALGARAARKPCVAARRAQRRDRSKNAARVGQELRTKILVRLRAASKCACFSFAQLQGPLSCDRGSSTQFRVVSSCTSAWRTQLEPSRTAVLLLSAALRHLEPQPRLRLGVRPRAASMSGVQLADLQHCCDRRTRSAAMALKWHRNAWRCTRLQS